MSILRITLHAIIRNPRRILTLGLGIILVTAFITGVFLSIDYRGQELLTEILKHVDVDFEIAIAHALLLTSIVPAWHLTRKNLAKILRIHH